jgi:hypothetical protein
VNSAVLLYREAMACPKRQARFAEIRARALAAVERADAMELHWQECRAAQGRNRSKPIQVGRGRV